MNSTPKNSTVDTNMKREDGNTSAAPHKTGDNSTATTAPSHLGANIAKKIGRPKFSIVIPTRQRHDTLEHAIQSTLNQDFDDYEVVVMDNCSTQETEDTARKFDSEHIKYFRAPERLAMYNNWELGLSHASGEYIFFLGDDDAVLPDALSRCDRLLDLHKVDIVSWQKPNYWWSTAIVPWHRNRLYLSLSDDIYICSSRSKLDEFYQLQAIYVELPMIYNSFVHRDIIEKISSIHGRYFVTKIPDVYSGIVNAYFSDTYLFSNRALSISGNSGHSTGCSQAFSNLSSKAKNQFDKEVESNGYEYDSILIPSSNMEILVAEEMLRVKSLFFPNDDDFTVDPIELIETMVANINFNSGKYDETLADIERMSEKHGLEFDKSTIPPKASEERLPFQGFYENSGTPCVCINCEQAGISDVAHAAKLALSLYPQ